MDMKNMQDMKPALTNGPKQTLADACKMAESELMKCEPQAGKKCC